MFDKESITLLQQADAIRATSAAVAEALEADGFVALPSDFQKHDLESFKPMRRRARGNMETSDINSFASYTIQHAEDGATVFVDVKSMAATAVLNLGTKDAPGHADNQAKIKLQATAAYLALTLAARGTPLTQVQAAEFLEDWPDLIKCFNDDGEISKPQAIAAVRKISIEAMRKMQSSEQSLSASKSAFESIQATSADPIPTTIYFTCEPYQGLESRAFVLRLSILTAGDKPSIVLRIVKRELHEEEMANEFANRTRDALLSKLPVHIGSYTASR